MREDEGRFNRWERKRFLPTLKEEERKNEGGAERRRKNGGAAGREERMGTLGHKGNFGNRICLSHSASFYLLTHSDVSFPKRHPKLNYQTPSADRVSQNCLTRLSQTLIKHSLRQVA